MQAATSSRPPPARTLRRDGRSPRASVMGRHPPTSRRCCCGPPNRYRRHGRATTAKRRRSSTWAEPPIVTPCCSTLEPVVHGPRVRPRGRRRHPGRQAARAARGRRQGRWRRPRRRRRREHRGLRRPSTSPTRWAPSRTCSRSPRPASTGRSRCRGTGAAPPTRLVQVGIAGVGDRTGRVVSVDDDGVAARRRRHRAPGRLGRPRQRPGADRVQPQGEPDRPHRERRVGEESPWTST